MNKEKHMNIVITGKPHRSHNEIVEEAFASCKAAYPDTPDWQIEV